MSKKDFELTAIMRDDLMAAYRDVVSSCYTQKQAWEKTVKHPAPRYYVSAKQAHDVLRKMVKGDFSEVDAFRPQKKSMYYSLYRKLLEMSQQREYLKKSLWYICQFLVIQPAPEFFLSTSALQKNFMLYKKYGKYFRENKIYKHKNKESDNNTMRTNANNGDKDRVQ